MDLLRLRERKRVTFRMAMRKLHVDKWLKKLQSRVLEDMKQERHPHP